MNLPKALFQKKVKAIVKMGRTPVLETKNETKTIVLSFRDNLGELAWETVCKASMYDVLNRQEKKYLGWFNEAVKGE
jgi:hypothetical protein